MTRKFTPLTRPKSLDFYSIYEDAAGIKNIHIFGYCFESDENNWHNIECCFFIEPLNEFIKHVEENEDYVDETYQTVKQYEGDGFSDEDMVNTINTYFGGQCPDAYLGFGFITEDTPCGDYVC